MKKHLNIILITLLSANVFAQHAKSSILESWLEQAKTPKVVVNQLADFTSPQPKLGLTYCTPANIPTPEEITKVTIKSNANTYLVNSSGNDTNIGYEDFTALTPAKLQQSSYYDITLEGDTKGLFYSSFTVMIDFNQDGNFSNYYDNYSDSQSEIIFGDDLLYNSNGKDGKSITVRVRVPQDAKLGQTRMRILKRQTDDRAAFHTRDGCDIGSTFGQVEDYTINVVEPVACTNTPNGAVTNEVILPVMNSLTSLPQEISMGSYVDIFVYKDVKYFFEVNNNTKIQLALKNIKTNKVLAASSGAINFRSPITGVVRLYIHSDENCTVGTEKVKLELSGTNPNPNPINEACNFGIPTTQFQLLKEFKSNEELAFDINASPGRATTISGIKINLLGEATQVDFDLLADANELPSTLISKIKGKIVSKKLIATINGIKGYEYNIDFDQPITLDALESDNVTKKWLKLVTDAQAVEINALYSLGNKFALKTQDKWTKSPSSEFVYQLKADCSYSSCKQTVPEAPKILEMAVPELSGATTNKNIFDVVVDKNYSLEIDGLDIDYWVNDKTNKPEIVWPEMPFLKIFLLENNPKTDMPYIQATDKTIKNIPISTIDTAFLENYHLKYEGVIYYHLEKFRAKIDFKEPLKLDGKNTNRYWLSLEEESNIDAWSITPYAEHTVGKTAYTFSVPANPADPLLDTDAWLDHKSEFVYNLKIRCSSLATTEIEKLGETKIYPNPFRDILTIESIYNIKAVEIYNMAGLKVNSKEMNTKTAQLNLSNLPVGVYILKAIDEKGKVSSQKIIKK